ncbi:MAG: DUF3857 domain-containing protein [Bacteroidales bacterium]|nr:DUF3857 domain-containing protein [Bacteroidales bacterium]
MTRILTITLLCTLSLHLSATRAPVKFGKPDLADLQMTLYDPDTSAVAVVLCDYGYFDNQKLSTIHILRIKILKKEGLDWANRVFNGSDDLTIRGRTYNLVDDKIVTDKLKAQSIFRERIYGDHYRIKVSLPNVRVGSIIDIEVRMFGLPDSWYFQREIPVRWSEFRLEESEYIDFRKNYTGYIPFYESSRNRWVTKDVPAFKDEPYTSSSKNYITKFDFDILSYQIPGRFYKSVTTTWDAVAKQLNQHSYFGEALRGNLFLNSVAKEIQEKTSDKKEQLQLAYTMLRRVKWDESSRLYATNPSSLKSCYDDGTGSSADINLMLVSLLKKLDIEAYPVVMSTRANGYLPPFPTLEKLNYTLCYARIGEEELLLDNTEEYLGMNLLPIRCLNNSALILKDQQAQIINIPAKGKEKINAVYNLTIEEDNTLSGEASFMRDEYAAYDFRSEYKRYATQDEYLENMENQYSGLRVSSMDITNLENIQEPLKDSYTCTIRNAINASGDRIYINPLFHHQVDENPFKTENRNYPVDYAYQRSKTIIVNYIIPEGYEVEQLPESTRFSLPDNAASMLYNVAHSGNKIMVVYKIEINRVIHLSGDYGLLREFYNMIVKKHAEPLILKKV